MRKVICGTLLDGEGTGVGSRMLAPVVGANEETRRVVGVARRMNLVAVNAMLMARRGGRQSVGFSVAARELRAYCDRQVELMGELDERMRTLVRAVARLLMDRRVCRQLGLVVAGGTDVASALAACRDRLARDQATIDDQWQALGKWVRGSLKASDVGRALARAAQVEAAYGGDVSVALGQVADEVEATVERIRASLTRLANGMAAGIRQQGETGACVSWSGRA